MKSRAEAREPSCADPPRRPTAVGACGSANRRGRAGTQAQAQPLLRRARHPAAPAAAALHLAAAGGAHPPPIRRPEETIPSGADRLQRARLPLGRRARMRTEHPLQRPQSSPVAAVCGHAPRSSSSKAAGGPRAQGLPAYRQTPRLLTGGRRPAPPAAG